MMMNQPTCRLLYTATLLMDACVGANVLLLVLFALHITDRDSVVGMLVAVMILARIPFNLVGGPISDRIGRRPFMVIAGCMLILALWILGAAESVWTLTISAILSGSAAGLIWFNIEAALGDHGLGMALHHRVGNFNLYFSLGMISGPWLIGQIVTRSEIGALFATMALAATVTLCLMLAPLSPIRATRDREEETRPGTSDRFFWAALLANIIIRIGFGVLWAVWPKRIVDLNYTASVVGNLYVVCYGPMLAGFVWMKLDSRWHYRRWPMMACLALGALGMAVLGVTDHMRVLTAGLALYGLAIALAYYAVLFTALDRPAGRGRRSGQHEAALAVGAVIGSQGGGLLAESLGPHAPYSGVSLLCLLAMGAVWWLAGSASRAASSVPMARPADKPANPAR